MEKPIIEQKEQAFQEFIETYKHVLSKFIGYADDAEIVLDEKAKTFYFSPKGPTIGIPESWFNEYLNKGDGTYESQVYGKFGMAHEYSHFRDMLKEAEILDSSMYKTLKRIQKKRIKVAEGKSIPIGEFIHTFYNCIDDIIVNQEVIRFKEFGIDEEQVKTFYQDVNFADYVEEPGGGYVPDPKTGSFVYVGEGKGTHGVNKTAPVDYSLDPDYKALSYFFLRSVMVPDQPIELSDRLNKVLYHSSSKNSFCSRKKSVSNLRNLFSEEIEKVKEGDDPDKRRRYEKYKISFQTHLGEIDKLVSATRSKESKIFKLLAQLFQKISGQYDPAEKNIFTVSWYDIISFFTYSRGADQRHALCVEPNLRYKIYQHLFEPVIETFILLDLLEHDPEEMKSKFQRGERTEGAEGEGAEGEGEGAEGEGEGAEGEGEGEEGEGEGEEGEKGAEEGNRNEKKNDDLPTEGTGSGTYRRSIEEKIKTLEEADEENKRREREKKMHDLKKKAQYETSSILDNQDLAPGSKELYNQVIQNFQKEIQHITNFLYKELEVLDHQYESEKRLSKKGKLDYDEFTKRLPDHLDDGDFSKSPIYQRSELVRQLQEAFKKIRIYIVTDVSGSTDQFKGPNGLLNGMVTSFAAAWKNVEKKIQVMLRDPDYTIPIKFVVYTDEIVYPTKKSKAEEVPFEVELIRANGTIATVSGGTDDAAGWSRVTDFVDEDFQEHPEVVKDLQDGDMKTVVLQVADTDVSENGVEFLERMLLKKYGDIINKRVMKKRVILGSYRSKELTEEELLHTKKGNWDVDYLRDAKGNIVKKDGKNVMEVKELEVHSRESILQEIEYGFKDFFADLIKQK